VYVFARRVTLFHVFLFLLLLLLSFSSSSRVEEEEDDDDDDDDCGGGKQKNVSLRLCDSTRAIFCTSEEC
jgi:hypothetical protein